MHRGKINALAGPLTGFLLPFLSATNITRAERHAQLQQQLGLERGVSAPALPGLRRTTCISAHVRSRKNSTGYRINPGTPSSHLHLQPIFSLLGIFQKETEEERPPRPRPVEDGSSKAKRNSARSLITQLSRLLPSNEGDSQNLSSRI